MHASFETRKTPEDPLATCGKRPKHIFNHLLKINVIGLFLSMRD
jgi:hypothetical protein